MAWLKGLEGCSHLVFLGKEALLVAVFLLLAGCVNLGEELNLSESQKQHT